jgi:hypothetical protein
VNLVLVLNDTYAAVQMSETPAPLIFTDEHNAFLHSKHVLSVVELYSAHYVGGKVQTNVNLFAAVDVVDENLPAVSYPNPVIPVNKEMAQTAFPRRTDDRHIRKLSAASVEMRYAVASNGAYLPNVAVVVR